MTLSAEQRERFSRHIALDNIGEAGQERLLKSKVLLIGAGGLGSAAGYYLAAAGVGTIGVVDSDTVEPSNLQRQILHANADIGRLKAESAAEKMRAIHPFLDVRAHVRRFDESSAAELLDGYDFAIDATDNFASKFLIADACHRAGTPYSHGGIEAFCGQTMTVYPGRTTCYRCVFETQPETNASEAPRGPFGVLPGVIGVIQATEAIKHCLALGDMLTDRILVYDALTLTFRRIRVAMNPDCPLCGSRTGT